MALQLGALARSRSTARLRLTLLYSGMFLLLGTIIVVVIFLLTSASATIHTTIHVVGTAAPGVRPGRGAPPAPGQPAGTLVAPEIVHQQRTADLHQLLTASWLVLLLTALASTVLGWFIAGRVLRPLRQMTDTARTISARNLGERLALSGPEDEFKRLGDTFDSLLARLEASFEAQRRFVANAAHELRTPLTVDRTLLQVALANPSASAKQLRITCEELLASGREQERLLEALLTLASSERGLEHREPVDLATVADRVVLGSEAGFVKTSFAAAPTSGDPALIERLIANLLDNAIRHNDARGVVEIRTGSEADRAYVTVLNTGPLVPASALEQLFEPFQRVGDRRTAETEGHHGLGLSIVRAIALAHDGRIDARPQESGGLAVTVSFPRSSSVSEDQATAATESGI
jgi:signal transduction histidine kinase